MDNNSSGKNEDLIEETNETNEIIEINEIRKELIKQGKELKNLITNFKVLEATTKKDCEGLSLRETVLLKRILNEIKQKKLDSLDLVIKTFIIFRDKNESLYKFSETKFKNIEDKMDKFIYILIFNSIVFTISIIFTIIRINKKEKK
ncbi:MAG: hypothetical protein AM1032_000369 [Mycoplasmataceae bacterium]|nr:MAG: hypothetical protein AM1032_000369 [Mycoplasmataceae bacterium]